MHQYIHNVGLRVETEIPDVFQNHGFGHRTSRMTQQQFEQGKFARLEFDFLSGANHFPGKKIHFEIAH